MKPATKKVFPKLEKIANDNNVDVREIVKAFEVGYDVENEHRKQFEDLGLKKEKLVEAIANVAITHLSESTNYYSELAKMEDNLTGDKMQKKIKLNPLLSELSIKKQELSIIRQEYDYLVSLSGEKELLLKSQITEAEIRHDEILYAGITNEDKVKYIYDCGDSMPEELIHAINRLFQKINKSPYSCSVYSGEKSWSYTELDSYCVCDHWNFYSQGAYHKLTTVDPLQFIKEKYPDDIGIEYWFLAQYKQGETCFDSYMADQASEVVGAWVILDAFPKDFNKLKSLSELRIKKNDLNDELRNIIPVSMIREINDLSSTVLLYEWLIKNNYTSFEDYKKKTIKSLKEKELSLSETIKKKIADGLITGTVTKREWGGSASRYKLTKEWTESGDFVDKTPTTITIRKKDGTLANSKDYTLDITNLTEDEKTVFYGYKLCENVLSELTNKRDYEVCINSKLK